MMTFIVRHLLTLLETAFNTALVCHPSETGMRAWISGSVSCTRAERSS